MDVRLRASPSLRKLAGPSPRTRPALLLVLAGLLAAPAPAQEKATLLARIPNGLRLEGEPVFSPDGRRVAFAAQGRRGWRRIVVDGKAHRPRHYADSPIFSADGGHVAWREGERVSSSQERWWIVVDGKAGPVFDWVGPPALSPDGKHVAYWVGEGVRVSAAGPYAGGRYRVIVDGKKGPAFRGGNVLAPPVFSPDGRRVGYVAESSRGQIVVVGRYRSRPYAAVGLPVFSPRGQRFVYPVFDGRRWYLEDHRGKRGKGYDFISAPVFDPQGRRVAFAARLERQWFVVVNGRRAGRGWDGVGPPVFGPRGRRLAYAANRGGAPPELPPGAPSLPGIGAAIRGGKWRVVAGSRRYKEHDAVKGPVLGPDGKAIAYAARDGKVWRLVVNGRAGPPHAWLGRPVFAPDGRSIGCGARDGRKLLWLVAAVP